MERTMGAFARRVAWAVVFSLLLSTAAFAQKAHKPDAESSAEEAAKFEAEVRKMINRSGEGLTVYTLDNGTKVVDLQGRFQNVSLATVKADGTVSTTCVSTKREAEQFLKRDEAQPTQKTADKKAAKKSAPAMEVK